MQYRWLDYPISLIKRIALRAFTITINLMTPSIPLESMSLAEKLHLMEEIWADLSQTGSGFTPPSWHGDVLDERRKLYQGGEIESTDWEEAKREIDRAVS